MQFCDEAPRTGVETRRDIELPPADVLRAYRSRAMQDYAVIPRSRVPLMDRALESLSGETRLLR